MYCIKELLFTFQYAQYQRFATEEFVLRSGGVLCPQPGCGMGILADPECTKITCINGCGVSIMIKLTDHFHFNTLLLFSLYFVDCAYKDIILVIVKYLKGMIQRMQKNAVIMLIPLVLLKHVGMKLQELLLRF